MKKILQKESPILRDIASEVPLRDITSPKIQKILGEMRSALASQDDGVAIAAPQIGYSLRIFIVSGRIEKIVKNAKSGVGQEENKNSNSVKSASAKDSPSQDTIFINPIIKKISKEKKIVEEGCLSVRYLYGKVSRGNKAIVEAYDEKGEKFTRGGSGLLAQIFQHEVDHLNGILFIDKAKYVEEILPEKQTRQYTNENK